jgi:hypothetical protein
MLLLLVGCRMGPALEGGTWSLDGLLPGDVAPQLARADCELVVELREEDGGDLSWPERCGRQDLPSTWRRVDTVPSAGRVYEVESVTDTTGTFGVGVSDVTQVWLTRPGDHPGLYELWVFPADTEIGGVLEFDADAILWMWREDDEEGG